MLFGCPLDCSIMAWLSTYFYLIGKDLESTFIIHSSLENLNARICMVPAAAVTPTIGCFEITFFVYIDINVEVDSISFYKSGLKVELDTRLFYFINDWFLLNDMAGL